ncbi:hypothetical protein BKA82DRAFT_1002446 [Pisolithus tinctorius]|uniref:Uncharacterized protein n=1 Tax=Pisolithus tinctorius Marx 270 TaxID=870435 RepID=A0A0C3P569_PISTI|nr:hypothetical protein BKA82DRAFT_1002446 [Pisolithus tinctorius]KIO02424.1 hypothetical protein M404DRAFT_1002446 [Pisolithus tinctorius Marx 270]
MKWLQRRRREDPWEVVGCETVNPVSMLDSEDDDDLIYVHEGDTCGRYIFDFTKQVPSGVHCASALQFARQQLLQQVTTKGYNILLEEGWSLTLLRRGERHRIQVDYTGRPGCMSGKLPPLRAPPFVALLEGKHIFS